MKRGGINVNHTLLNRQGFTLFEIILTLLILAIAIIPMVNAFTPALLMTGQGEEQAVLTGQARQTMNRLLDLDFRTLDANRGNPADLTTLFGSAAEAAKENLDYLGQTYVPTVAITDASSGAGGLLELKVTLKNVKLQTLKAER
jgi:prepilin-type N-terminal cleavage/methylation domain-containing protein